MPDPQEPRTGGVARESIAYPLAVALDGVSMPDHKFNAAVAAVQKLLASQAEALIDPNDPAVREVVIEALCSASAWDGTTRDKADAVIAALRGDS